MYQPVRIDAQLEKSLGMTNSKEDAATRLERLFRQSSEGGDLDVGAVSGEADAAEAAEPPQPRGAKWRQKVAGTAKEAAAGKAGAVPPAAPKGPSLKEYVEGFDQKTMMEMARLVSQEGAGLVERQTTGLFGKLADLQRYHRAAL